MHSKRHKTLCNIHCPNIFIRLSPAFNLFNSESINAQYNYCTVDIIFIQKQNNNVYLCSSGTMTQRACNAVTVLMSVNKHSSLYSKKQIKQWCSFGLSTTKIYPSKYYCKIGSVHICVPSYLFQLCRFNAQPVDLSHLGLNNFRPKLCSWLTWLKQHKIKILLLV